MADRKENNESKDHKKTDNSIDKGEQIPVNQETDLQKYRKRNFSVIDIKAINNTEDANSEMGISTTETANNLDEFDFYEQTVEDSDYKENRHLNLKETDQKNQGPIETKEIEKSIEPRQISLAYSIYNFLFSSILYIVFIVIVLEICYMIFFSYFLGVVVLKGKRKIISNEKDHLNAVSLIESIFEIEKKRLLIKNLNKYSLIKPN